MGAEAGDARRQGDAAAPMLQGEGSGEEAPAALVGGGEKPVDRTVGLRRSGGQVAAGRSGTGSGAGSAARSSGTYALTSLREAFGEGRTL